jgi:ketosteroid isomerase-like protein
VSENANAHLTSETTRQALQEYYDGIRRKEKWDKMLSEDFLLTGTVAKEIRGKHVYANLAFWKLVRNLRVKELVVEGERAFALVNYDLVSPKGTPFSADVAEFWITKQEKLASLAIYFDTAAFNNSMSQ